MDLYVTNYCGVCGGKTERRGEGPRVHVASWNQRLSGVKVGPDCPGAPEPLSAPERNDSGGTPSVPSFVACGTGQPALHRDEGDGL